MFLGWQKLRWCWLGFQPGTFATISLKIGQEACLSNGAGQKLSWDAGKHHEERHVFDMMFNGAILSKCEFGFGATAWVAWASEFAHLFSHAKTSVFVVAKGNQKDNYRFVGYNIHTFWG